MNKKLLKPLSIAVLFMLMYLPTLIWMWQRWMAKDSYYGHGILVPLVSGLIIWQKLKVKNKKSEESKKNSHSNFGLVLMGTGLFIHLLSAWMRIYFSSAFSMLLILSGIALYLGGKDALRTFSFPIFFLIFMIPLPLVAIANIVFKMKILAAQISTILVNKMGIPAIRAGSTIYMRHSNLIVGDPCSGLRSLISLFALGCLFGYYLKASRARKAILCASSVPLALTSNIFRIVLLCFVSEVYGTKYTEGFVHNFAGMMVFVLAFSGLFIVSRVLE